LKKRLWLIGILVAILIGGVSLFTFNQNEKERKEKQVIKMETVTAKQIKNTFSDVIEIKFSEKYNEKCPYWLYGSGCGQWSLVME
jgi:hypothetical protein